jgi:polar amino acid transport system permease protein
MPLHFGPILEQWPYLLGGAWLSLEMAVLAFTGGMLTCAALLQFAPPYLRRLITSYVTFATNTPQLVQIYFLFFGLPEVGVVLPPLGAALVGMTFNAGAYLCEILRAGILSLRSAELETAEVLGFSRIQVVRYVMIPHVMKVMFPSLSNQFIIMTLGTSMASVFGVEELTGRAENLGAETYLSVEAFSVAAVLYLTLSLVATFMLIAHGRLMYRIKARLL